MGIFKKLKNFFKKEPEGIGADEPVQENLEEEIQTTFNEDSLEELVEEGVVENVEVYNED